MITLETIKIMLTKAGCTRFKIDFDNDQNLLKVDYVFRGVPGNSQITYQEIKDSLTIGQPEATIGPGAAIAQELT